MRTVQSHVIATCGKRFELATWAKNNGRYVVVKAMLNENGTPTRVNGKKVPAVPLFVLHDCRISGCQIPDKRTPNPRNPEPRETPNPEAKEDMKTPAPVGSLDAIFGAIVDRTVSDLREEMAAMKADLEAKAGRQPIRVELRPGRVIETKPGDHVNMPKVAALLDLGPETKVWPYLYGPPGSGKSHAAISIALMLARQLFIVTLGPASLPSQLFGFRDANGACADTNFKRAWRDGGILLMDELDNCAASLLTMINGALANDIATFPDGDIKRHPDCWILATGNTPLKGGIAGHETRQKIDAATQDRFAFLKYAIDRDQEKSRFAPILERRADYLSDWLDAVRAHINVHRPSIIVSQRGAVGMAHAITRVPRAILSNDEILEAYVFRGIEQTVKEAVLKACPVPSRLFEGRA